jgi:hypothetical protein
MVIQRRNKLNLYLVYTVNQGYDHQLFLVGEGDVLKLYLAEGFEILDEKLYLWIVFLSDLIT